MRKDGGAKKEEVAGSSGKDGKEWRANDREGWKEASGGRRRSRAATITTKMVAAEMKIN